MSSRSKCALLLLSLTLAGCSALTTDEATSPAPHEVFDVRLTPLFDRTNPPSVRTAAFEATVASITSRREHAGGHAYTDTKVALSDLSKGDTARTLTFPGRTIHGERVLPADALPLAAGARYRFELTDKPYTWGTSSALRVTDDDGLVLFGLTGLDAQKALRHRLPEGWSAALRDADYRARTGECSVTRAPRVLSVSYRNETVHLAQGEEAAMKGYRVQARIARRVTYGENTGCTDLFVPEVSLLILRQATR